MSTKVISLVSIGAHPSSGRARRAEQDARAVELGLQLAGDNLQVVHAGDPREEALRAYLLRLIASKRQVHMYSDSGIFENESFGAGLRRRIGNAILPRAVNDKYLRDLVGVSGERPVDDLARKSLIDADEGETEQQGRMDDLSPARFVEREVGDCEYSRHGA